MGKVSKITAYCIGKKGRHYRLLASNGTTAFIDEDRLFKGTNYEKLIIPNLEVSIFGEVQLKTDVEIPEEYLRNYQKNLAKQRQQGQS